jgi:hypothetical protein
MELEKIFTNQTFDKARVYKRKKFNSKQAKDLNKHFSKDGLQMTSKCTKRYQHH